MGVMMMGLAIAVPAVTVATVVVMAGRVPLMIGLNELHESWMVSNH
ncbi:MAG: hypothetical protein AB7G13_13485 [Lautropia sp.]